MPLSVKKNIIDIIAPAGKVTSHERNILLIIRVSNAAKPRAKPTPSTAPTNTWVVDTGKPVPEAITTVDAAANVAAKPRGLAALDTRMINKIFLSWLVTLPAGAVMSIIFFFILKGIFGA